MWRVTAFLKRKPTDSRTTFVAHLRQILAAIAAHHPAPARTVLDLPMDPLPAQLEAMFGDRFDAVVELWFADGDAATVVMTALSRETAITDAAARVIDRARSSAWLAEVVPQIPPPEQHLKFVVAGQMADGMSMLDAQDYWRDEHPRLFLSVSDFAAYIVGYTQMHGRPILKPGLINWLATENFYPMCADMGLRSAEDVATAYSMPSYLSVVRPDEEKFSKPGDMLSFVSVQRESF